MIKRDFNINIKNIQIFTESINFETMRQLKGKVKENAKEKRERKKEFMENKDKAFTIGVSEINQGVRILTIIHFSALPFIGAAFVLVIVLVYVATRPKQVVG